MKLTIHDVGHGSCISLIHENGNTMLWDCGHQNNCRPSIFLPKLGFQNIDHLFITNYDEDHISDLPNLRQSMKIRSLVRNRSISTDQLGELKRQGGPISPAMESMLDMINKYNGGPLNPAPNFPRVRYRTFQNDYSDEFPDTNNISLVTFLEAEGMKFIIPGDLERKGWLGLLDNQKFKDELLGVTVFVASHHGRENGYCSEIFDIFCPNVIVFSDSSIKYATQEMSQCYAQHAKGIQFKGKTRQVLTTRNDDSLLWNL